MAWLTTDDEAQGRTEPDFEADKPDCKGCGDTGRDEENRICQECCGQNDREPRDFGGCDAFDQAGDR